MRGVSPPLISADILFLGLAGIAFLGFVLDALFNRLRITSVLPLMLLGLVLVATGLVPAGTVGLLNTFIPYVSALTVAFILFAVGLEIRFRELFRVLGRATTYTLVVQTATGIAIALLAYETIHWGLLISFIFGFGISGPSSIAVPVLVRVARMPEALGTSLLFESVISDVLQLLVPLLMIGFLVSGTVTITSVTSSLLETVLGSAAAGLVAGLAWLWLLDRLRGFAQGYTWTLTITMVLATYGAADRLGLSAAITIFVFGLALGNAAFVDFRRSLKRDVTLGWFSSGLRTIRRRLGISTRGLDIPHILQVQREVSFFASAFFFVYIGLLFEFGALTLTLVLVTAVASIVMLAVRFAGSPILSPYLDTEPAARRSQRGLLTFNISRGLAAAVIATVPQGLGIVIPGFLDAMFLGILFSTVVSTIGIFALYSPDAGLKGPLPAGVDLSFPTLEFRLRQPPLPQPPPATPGPYPQPPSVPSTPTVASDAPASASEEPPGPPPPLPSGRRRGPPGSPEPDADRSESGR